MKKFTSILSLLLLLSFSALQAQVATISIADTPAVDGSEISVPLSTNNKLEDIGSLTFNITYDSNVLTFSDEIANSTLLNSGSLQVNHVTNGANSVISIGWFGLDPITLQDKILDLKFVYIEGTSSLSFSGLNEVTDKNNANVNVAFGNGSVFPAGQGPLSFALSDEVGDAGNQVTVDFSAKNIYKMGSMQFSIKYDSAILEYVELADDVVGFTVNSDTDGVLKLAMFSTTGYSFVDGVLAGLVFNFKGGSSAVTFDQTAVELTKLDQTAATATFTDGSVNNTPSSFALSNAVAYTGENASVSLSAANFTNLGAFTIFVKYDSANLTFVELANQTAAGTFSANAANGVLTIGYFNTAGLTVVNEPLIDLVFTYAGGTNVLDFDETNAATEIIALDQTPIAAQFTNGSVALNTANRAPVFGAVLPDTTVAGGSTLAFTYTGTDADSDALTFALVSGPTGMTVSAAGALSWAVAKGTHQVVVSLTDGTDTVQDTATVTVLNQAPAFTAVLPDTSIVGGTTLSYAYAGSDADSDALTFTLVSGPEGLTVDEAGALSYSPAIATDGTFAVVVSLSDGTDSVVDSASVTVTPGIVDVTITQIQTPTDTTDVSPYVDMLVKVAGVVTGIDTIGSGQGYFIQDGNAEYSGLWVFDRTNKPAEGDNITVTGTIKEYFTQTELDNVTDFIVNSSGNELPAPVLLATGSVGEAYESVLVKFENAVVTNADAGFGEWEVDDGSGPVLVDEQLFDYTPELGAKLNITGPLNFTFSNFKIAPRNMGDIEVVDESDKGAVVAIELSTGNLGVTAFNDGNFGYHDDSSLPNRGVGITWKGANGLWKAASVYGTTSAGQAVGNAHNNSTGINDIANVESYWGRDGIQSNADFDQVTPIAVFSDGGVLFNDITVATQVFANNGEDWIFVRYGFINHSASTIDDLYGGMFLDLDVGPGSSYTTNEGGLAEGEWLAYQYHDDSNPYFGVAAINGWSGAAVSSDNVENQDDFRGAAFDYLTNVNLDAPATGDQRTWIGSKVNDVAAGDTSWVTFAILAADNLHDIRQFAEQAFMKAKAVGWTDLETDIIDEIGVPEEFSLAQNYPNPFNPTTTIKYGLPEASKVTIKVYNLLGETVDVLVSSDMAAGYHSINWNASNLSSGIYFYTIEANSISGGKDFSVVKKMMLLK